MILYKSRREREYIIVSAMIRMFCRNKHGSGSSLCTGCAGLNEYAHKRLEKCVFVDLKPVCKDCPVHCYAPMKREEMRTVMRWAGPRMLYRHPLYSLIHLIDSNTTRKPENKTPSQ